MRIPSEGELQSSLSHPRCQDDHERQGHDGIASGASQVARTQQAVNLRMSSLFIGPR